VARSAQMNQSQLGARLKKAAEAEVEKKWWTIVMQVLDVQAELLLECFWSTQIWNVVVSEP
jgi:hypothetical protein